MLIGKKRDSKISISLFGGLRAPFLFWEDGLIFVKCAYGALLCIRVHL